MNASKTFTLAAWAVHNGDVALVPEPESWALMLLGLLVMGTVRGAARDGRVV